MKPAHTCPDGIAATAYRADSHFRWDWTNRQAYEITDRARYESRFDHFHEFRKAFYNDVTPNPLTHGNNGFVCAEYPDHGMLVVGFASWHGNDCFCRVGDIDPTALALSQRVVAESSMPLAVAVWHHSIAGGPRVHDYMDQTVVHRLIDFGFRVGLHGHQHYPGAAPFEVRLPNATSMLVVGAGSLAVGDRDLPMGERRQFNLVEIDTTAAAATVHVRGMSPAGVFTGMHRDDFGGQTFLRCPLPSGRGSESPPVTFAPLDDAIAALGHKRYDEALSLVAKLPPDQSAQKRTLRIEALRALGRQNELIEALTPPHKIREVVELVALLLDAGRLDDAARQLHDSKALLPLPLFEEISTQITARGIAN